MNSKCVLKLKRSIVELSSQISGLKNKLENSEQNNVKFNKLLIRKAILKQELDKQNCSILKMFFKRFTHRKEKLICDYFKS